MKDLTKKYIELADEYGEQMEDFARISGLIRGLQIKGTPTHIQPQAVPGDVIVGNVVGNIGLTATRTLTLLPAGQAPINFNLPVLLGSAFAFADEYNFALQKILNISGITPSVNVDPLSNSIIFKFTDANGVIEQITLSGGNNYSILSLMKGLFNVSAKLDKVRISLPTEDNSRLNAWQRDGMAQFNLSWLSNFNSQPVTLTRAPGQFNKSIYDSNFPITINNTSGIAVFIPALPSNAVVGTSESTDITLYFDRISKI